MSAFMLSIIAIKPPACFLVATIVQSHWYTLFGWTPFHGCIITQPRTKIHLHLFDFEQKNKVKALTLYNFFSYPMPKNNFV